MSLRKLIIFNIYTLLSVVSCVPIPFMPSQTVDCSSLMDCKSLEITGGRLCVFHVQSTLDEWFFFPPQGNSAIKLEAMPQSLVNVDEFKIAPSEKWITITSVGEGHPIVDVIVLADALTDEATTALRTINPYPGYINVKHWVDDNLIVESDKDLTKPDDTSESTLLDEAISFSLHVPSGEIKLYKQ